MGGLAGPLLEIPELQSASTGRAAGLPYLYLPVLVCVQDQRREKPNYFHKITGWHAYQAC
jgi:hypothetical protein